MDCVSQCPAGTSAVSGICESTATIKRTSNWATQLTVNPTVSNAKPSVTFILELQGITAAQLVNSTVKTKLLNNFATLIRVKPSQVQLIVLASRRILSASSISVQINVMGINATQSASITQRTKSYSLSDMEAIFTSAGLPVTLLSWTVVNINQETVRPTIQTELTTGSTTAPISFPATNSKIGTEKAPLISGISYTGGLVVVMIVPILFFLCVAGNVFMYWRRSRVKVSKVTYVRESVISPYPEYPTLPRPSHANEQKDENAGPEPVTRNRHTASVIVPYPNSNQNQNVAESVRAGSVVRVVPHAQASPQRSAGGDSSRPVTRADSRFGFDWRRKTPLGWGKFGDRNV